MTDSQPGDSCRSAKAGLVPNRECGDCVACCVLPMIETIELRKPERVMCTHCSGSACGIHATRPEVCRDYYCLWRTSAVLKEAHRPNQVGVLFQVVTEKDSPNLLKKKYVLGIPFERSPNLASPEMESLLSRLKQYRVPVWVLFGKIAVCVHPSPAVQDVILRRNATPTEAVSREAAEWIETMNQLR